ncbi:MAG: hypothetical protein RL094_421 [Candidatus Parcubacteria bacterium]|jgi:fructosamine-3-kinase
MSSITFLNQPRLTEHEVDKERNEKRLSLVPKIETFLSSHDLFKDKDVQVFFAQKGVMSLVSIIETPDTKYVLKIPLRAKPVEQEGAFLTAWEKVGVSVPHVIEEGVIDTHRYILMNYIDAVHLTEQYKLGGLVREKVFVQMGSTLKQMHTTVAQGYGQILDNKPQFSTFSSWITDYDHVTKNIEEVQEKSLLNDQDHGSIDTALRILIEYVEKDPRSTYCHNDFAPENIFATTPLTVFDPDPMFNHPIIDLGRTIVIATSRCGPSDAAHQLIEGYFKNETYDKKALQASILLGTYMKFPYWNKTAQEKRLAYLREYLSQNKNLLA